MDIVFPLQHRTTDAVNQQDRGGALPFFPVANAVLMDRDKFVSRSFLHRQRLPYESAASLLANPNIQTADRKP
jgi:hypothetical protein